MARVIDPVTNFAEVTPIGTYSAIDTTINLTSGTGGTLPDTTDGAFNLVWYNATDYTGPASDPQKEIVRVVTRTVDVLTVIRAQEATTATAKSIAGKTYKLVLAMTKRIVDQIDTQAQASQVLLDAIGVAGFPTQTGNAGKFLTTDGTALSFGTASGSSTFANVGTGSGTVYRNTVSGVNNLKTIKAGTNITITNNADDITINSSGGGGGGSGDVVAASNNAFTGNNTHVGSETFTGTVDFTGATVTGVSGSAATQENVTAFTGTSITIATTITSTILLFKNGSLITVAGGDYTISGQVITLTTASLITDKYVALIGVAIGGGSGDVTQAGTNTFTGTNNFSGATVTGIAGVNRNVKAVDTAGGNALAFFTNGATVDGVVISTGDYVLLSNQTPSTDNGLYLIGAGAPTLQTTRASDTFFATSGTSNGGKTYTKSSTVGSFPNSAVNAAAAGSGGSSVLVTVNNNLPTGGIITHSLGRVPSKITMYGTSFDYGATPNKRRFTLNGYYSSGGQISSIIMGEGSYSNDLFLGSFFVLLNNASSQPVAGNISITSVTSTSIITSGATNDVVGLCYLIIE